MAKKVVDRLVTELTADRAKMRSELEKSFRETQEWGQRVGKVVKYVGATVAALGVGGAAGLVEMSRRSAENARELQNMAYVANATAKEMQVLGYAGKEYNLTQGEISQQLKDINDRIGDFLETGAGPMADFFEKIAPKVGVTAANFKDLSGPQAMQLFISSLEKANLSQERMTFYMEQIAGDATALVPLFRNGGAELNRYRQEMEDLNLVMSDQEVADLAGLSAKFDKFGAILSVTGDRIALGAVPAIEDLMDLLSDPRVIQNLQTFGKVAVDSFTGLVNVISRTVEELEDLKIIAKDVGRQSEIAPLQEDLEELEVLIGRIKSNPIPGFSLLSGQALENYEAEAAAIRSQINLLRVLGRAEGDRYKNAAVPPLGRNEGSSSATPTPAVNLADVGRDLFSGHVESRQKLNDLAAEYIAQSERTIQLMDAQTEAAKLEFELESGRFAELTPARKDELRDAAEKIDLLNQERATQKALQEQLKEDLATASELRQMAMSEEEVIYANLRENLIELSDLVNKGVIGGEEGASISAALAEDAQQAADNLKGVTDEMSTFADEAARNMQSAFADFLFDPFEDGLDGMLKNFGTIIQRMAAEAAAAKIFESIGGWAGNNQSAGGLIGGVASLFGGFFADGGRPPMGKVSIVGEREPELFVPDTAGTIVPFSDLKSGGGGVSMGNIQMVFPGVGNAREADAAAGAAGRRLMNTINNAQRYR